MKRHENGRRILSTEVMAMQTNWKRIGLAVVSLGLAMMLVASACIPQVAKATPGEEKVVKVGLHMILSGAAADVGRAVRIWTAYLKYINDQGGLNGVKLEPVWRDVGRAPVPQGIIAHKRFKEAGAVVELSVFQAAEEALTPNLQRDEIPMVGSYGSALKVTKPMWHFNLFPSTRDLAAVAAEWLKDTWTKERVPRVGCFFWDNTAGWEDMEGIKWAAEKYGWEFVGYEVTSVLGTIDTTTEWLRLAGKKPDFIHTGWCAATQVVAVKDAVRLEIQKKGIILFDGGQCVDLILPIVKADLDGWYHTRWSCLVTDTDVPEIRVVREVAKKYCGWDTEEKILENVSSGTTVGIGWAIVKVAVEGIRLAIEKVGYENLTGRTVRDALASMRDFDLGLAPPGLPPQLVTMTDEEPFVFRGALVYRFEETTPQRISDKYYSVPNAWLPQWLTEVK